MNCIYRLFYNIKILYNTYYSNYLKRQQIIIKPIKYGMYYVLYMGLFNNVFFLNLRYAHN